MCNKKTDPYFLILQNYYIKKKEKSVSKIFVEAETYFRWVQNDFSKLR